MNQLAAKAGALTTLEPTKKDVKGGYVVTGSVGTDASEGFTELMQAAAAFNANVPVTGCEPNTDKDKVRRQQEGSAKSALRVCCTALFFLCIV